MRYCMFFCNISFECFPPEFNFSHSGNETIFQSLIIINHVYVIRIYKFYQENRRKEKIYFKNKSINFQNDKKGTFKCFK